MNFIGKICPYCKSEFKENDDVVICSVCEMPHHKECWNENKACTTFGCTGTIMGADNYNNGLFCTKCGAAYAEGDKFCSVCGNAILKAEQQLQNAYSPLQQQYPNFGQTQYENQTLSVNNGQTNTNYNSYNEGRNDEDIQAFIGVNQDYYFKKFKKFDIKNSKVSWNWASAFLGAYWYAYRKMYLIQFLYYVAYFFTLMFFGMLIAGTLSYTRDFTPIIVMMPLLIVFVLPFVLSGMLGNYIYKCHVEKHVQIANSMDDSTKRNYLIKKGGKSDGAVFVLIGISILLRIISAASKHSY